MLFLTHVHLTCPLLNVEAAAPQCSTEIHAANNDIYQHTLIFENMSFEQQKARTNVNSSAGEAREADPYDPGGRRFALTRVNSS